MIVQKFECYGSHSAVQRLQGGEEFYLIVFRVKNTVLGPLCSLFELLKSNKLYLPDLRPDPSCRLDKLKAGL